MNSKTEMNSTAAICPDNKTIEQVSPEDLPALDRLFRARFHHPLDRSLWSWKYGQNRGFALGSRTADKELSTHYGALSRAVLFHGQAVMALQMADVVASTRAIPGMSRQPPIYLAVKHIAETYLGLDKPFLLAFGFPNRRAYDVFEHLGIYQKAGNIFELSLAIPPISNKYDFWHFSQKIEMLSPTFKKEINRLWADLSRQSQPWIMPIKNADFFEYRYFSHPVNHYEVFSLHHRITRKAIAVFVLKKNQETQIELLDFVCPIGMIPTMIHHATNKARELGGSHLTCWASDPIRNQIAPLFDTVHDINVIIPTNAHTPSPPLEQIYQQWWLMGGDTDFK